MESFGLVVARDPPEETERCLPRLRVRDGDAVGERAGDVVLPGELVDERSVGVPVDVEDLGVVDRNAFREQSPKDLPDLVFLAECPEQAGVAGASGPRLRIVGLEYFEPSARQQIEQLLLTGAELEACGDKVDRAGDLRVPAAPAELLDRAPDHVRAVHETPVGERLLVRAQDRPHVGDLSGMRERFVGQVVRGHSRLAELVERALDRAMESRPISQPAEVRRFGQRFRAGLLDQGERLDAREKRQTLLGERAAHDRVGEAARALDAEVDPADSRASEALDDVVTDREGRRDEDLLVQREPAAGIGQRFTEPRRRSRRVGSQSVATAAEEIELRGHQSRHLSRPSGPSCAVRPARRCPTSESLPTRSEAIPTTSSRPRSRCRPARE